MFHQNPLNTPFGSNFEALLQLGFRGFEEPAALELSPLLSWLTFPPYVRGSQDDVWDVNRIKACIWLIDHFVNLWDPISGDSSATTAHYLYASMNLLGDWRLMNEFKTLRAKFLTRTLSTHDVRDNCLCRCSPGGCSPFVWFLRRNIDQNDRWVGPVDHTVYMIDQFPIFLRRWRPVISVEQLRSAIRFLTFEVLGIRHTCSHGYTQVDEPTGDDIEELMSEDASLLELLEQLVKDFDSELQSVITEEDPLGLNFWKTHWSVRMKEVYAELNEYRMDEGELLSAQQVGVTWHQLDGSPGRHQTGQNGVVLQGDVGWDIEVDNISYRESDWNVEVDDVEMWRTLRSVEDWTSRLDLIMSRAIPDWR